ncbi:uncharacterized protein LOC124439818 isoform X1 [Xenia sp. Carnegie-2017]|uniref:uncharacterized protein LOC124439818 isoform X1 n=1 Tax=Xenia sp. Carnegie-2017 TaxID=2897299 RepID=UPI001F04A7B9|nr:uncharacterized protein LOC124439818 isoform X1 [Xenia sp. Carnegie-2017]
MSNQDSVGVSINENVEKEKSSEQKLSIILRIKIFLLRNLFPFGIVLSVIFGIALPQPAVYLNEKIPLGTICVVCLFTTIGLRLRISEAKSAIKSYKEIVIGLILILFLVPFSVVNSLNKIPYFSALIGQQTNSRNASNMSSYEMKILGPEEFRIGLQIYFMSPSAPASSLILVTAANAHRGLCALLSILGVFISIFTMSSTLSLFLPTLNAQLSVTNLLIRNVLRILTPLVVGRSVRSIPVARKIIKSWNDALKYVGITCIILLLHVRISETNNSGHFEKVATLNVFCNLCLANAFVLIILITTYASLLSLPFVPKKSSITLSVLNCIRIFGMSASIVDSLPPEVGDKGLIILPMGLTYMTTFLLLNAFVYFVKIEEEENEKFDKEMKDKPNESVNSSAFTMYTDNKI